MRCFVALRQWELQTPDPTNDAAEFGNSAEQGEWSKRTKFERHPQQNERKLQLQTLEASPLSNRRSERPAEKPPANNKHSEGVPHLQLYDALLLGKRFCFARILKNKSGKTKELILCFSAMLLILQGFALRALPMTLIKAFGFPNSEQTMVGAYGTRSFVHSTNSRV